MKPNAISPRRKLGSGFWADLFFGFFLFAVWITLASYIRDASPTWQFLLYPILIGVFLWRYLPAGGASQPSELAIAKGYPPTWFRLPIRDVPFIAVLVTTMCATLPWMWAVKSGYCADPELFSRTFIPEQLPGAAGIGQAGGLALLVLRAAPFPIIEEFTFRNWLFAPLQSRFGPYLTVGVTSLLFATIHLRPRTFGTDLIFGALMGYALLATRSLWTPLILHYASNLGLDLLFAPPLANHFKIAMATQWFSCRTSVAVYVAGLIAIVVILTIAGRRQYPLSGLR